MKIPSRIKLPIPQFPSLAIGWPEVALAFLLGRTVVGGHLSPFGPAMYSAWRFAGHPSSTLVGISALIGCMTTRRWDLLGAVALSMALITLLVRSEEKKAQSSMGLTTPVLAGAIVSAASVLATCYRGGGLYHYLAAVFEGLCCAVCVRLLSFAFPALRFPSPREGHHEAFLVMSLLAIGGFQGVGLWGINLARLLALVCTVVAAYVGGPSAGAVAGLAGGLTVSLTGVSDPSTVALLGVSGLLAGAGGWFGKIETMIGFVSGGMLLFTYGLPGNIGQRMLEHIGAALSLLFVTPAFVAALRERYPVFQKETRPVKQKNQPIDPLRLHMAAVSHCLTQVGDMLKAQGSRAGLSRTRTGRDQRGTSPNVSPTVKFAVARVCQDCSNKAVCWETEFHDTYELVDDLARKVDILGGVQAADRDGALASRCVKFGELVSVMSHRKEVERLEQRLATATVETKEAVSFQYKCLGRLLSPLYIGASPKSSNGAPKLNLSLRGATIPAGGASRAGDLWARYDLGADKSLLVLVDGMGKGEAAAEQSKNTMALLKSLLDCGLDFDSCVSFLNSALFTVLNSDSFVAMDCLLIDGGAQKAYFHKLGSPPSFIRQRSGNVVTVRGARPPAGAFGSHACLSTTEAILPGDAVLLVSDGVFRASPVPARAERMIVSRLTRLKDDSVDSLFKAVISHGERYYGRTPPDDVTVVVAKLGEG